MKFLYILCCIVLLSCSNKNTMIVEGSAPAVCNGAKVYFVPRPAQKSGKGVDSTIIKNEKFRFEVVADSLRMAEISISWRANLHMEKILVAIEKGTLVVKLDTVSSANGTDNNNRLQQWKNAIVEQHDAMSEIRKELIENIKTNDTAAIAKLNLRGDSVNNKLKTETFNFIKSNINAMGGYIFKAAGRSTLDSAQIAKLKQLGIEKFAPKNIFIIDD